MNKLLIGILFLTHLWGQSSKERDLTYHLDSLLTEDYDQYKLELHSLLKKDSNNLSFKQRHIEILWEEGQVAKALGKIQKDTLLQAQIPHLYAGLLNQANQPDSALQILQSLDTLQYETRIYTSQALIQQKKFRSALSHLEISLSLFPQTFQIHHQVALVLQQTNHPFLPLVNLYCITLSPNDSISQDLLSQIQSSLLPTAPSSSNPDQLAKAIQQLIQTYKFNPHNTWQKTYRHFFQSLTQFKNLFFFSYFVQTSRNSSQLNEWLLNHANQLEPFFEWLNQQQHPDTFSLAQDTIPSNHPKITP